MAKNNIYDKIISELILRLEQANNTLNPQLILTSTLASPFVPVGFSGSVAFTSTVQNIPSGYSVAANTHIISYPTAVPSTIGSGNILTGASTPVALSTIGSSFIVTATVDLIGSGPTITLTSTFTIAAVSPSYYGVINYSPTPSLTGLTSFASTAVNFQLTNTPVGRLVIAVPVGSPSIVSLAQSNGLTYPASDFTVTTSGGFNFYQLNYNTQFTGANLKTFTINYI